MSEGNVTKVDQLRHSDPEVLKALQTGEIRIHRAWFWRALSSQQQRERLRLHRLERGLKHAARAQAVKHRVNGVSKATPSSPSMASLKQLLQQLSSLLFSDSEASDSIAIGLISSPGKAVLLTTELCEDLLARSNAN